MNFLNEPITKSIISKMRKKNDYVSYYNFMDKLGACKDYDDFQEVIFEFAESV